MKAGDGRAEMLGTAGSSSVGTAPPPACGTRGPALGARGAAFPCSCCALAAACNVPAGRPKPSLRFPPPHLCAGGAGQQGEHWWDPTKDGAEQQLHFWGGRMGGKQEVSQGCQPPLLLEPPSSGHPRSQRARGCPSPGSCVSPLRRPWHNGGTAKPCPGGQAAMRREPGLCRGRERGFGCGRGRAVTAPARGATLHESESRSGRRRVRGNHTRQSRRRIAFQTQTT